MRTLRTLVRASLVVGVFAACRPTIGGPSPVVPGEPRGTRLPRPTTTAATAAQGARYVCRGYTPSGYIAVDYIDDAENCSTSRMRFGVAVTVPLSTISVGQVLEVCAEERIPNNFHETRLLPGDPRCPTSKPTADPGRATVREILRDR